MTDTPDPDPRVGTVEILTTRIYPIDPRADVDDPDVATVVVQPGRYPLHRHGDGRYWMMTGHVNLGGRSAQVGPDMFVLGAADQATGPEVRFPSRMFWPGELESLRDSHPAYTEGSPTQALRFLLDDTDGDAVAEPAHGGVLTAAYAEGLGAVLVAAEHGLLMKWWRENDKPDESTTIIVQGVIRADGTQWRGADDVRDAHVVANLYGGPESELRLALDRLARDHAAGRLSLVVPDDSA